MYALKPGWTRKVKNTNHKWKSILNLFHPNIENLDKHGASWLVCQDEQNHFWKDTFQAYSMFCKRVKPISPSDILAEPLFSNRNINLDNLHFNKNKWIERNVCYIANLCKEDELIFQVTQLL